MTDQGFGDYTVETKMSGFTPVFDDLVKQYGLIVAGVFGRMWRYAQQKNNKGRPSGVCYASQEKIADDLQLNRRSVIRAIKVLIDNNYLEFTGNNGRTNYYLVKPMVIKIAIMTENEPVTLSHSRCDLESQQVSPTVTAGVTLSHTNIQLNKEIKNPLATEKRSRVGQGDTPKRKERVKVDQFRRLEDFNWMPHERRALAEAFVGRAGAAYMPLEKDKKLWHKITLEWHNLGMTPENVTDTVASMEKKGLSIAGPQSITNMAKDELAKSQKYNRDSFVYHADDDLPR